MAEAHNCVAPMAAMQSGFEVDTSCLEMQLKFAPTGIVLFVPHPKWLLRNLWRHLANSWIKTSVAFLPVPLWAVLGTVCAVSVWVTKSDRSSWQRSGRLATALWNIDTKVNPFAASLSRETRVGYLAFLCGSVGLYGIAMFERLCIRQLLKYHGWMAERKTKSTKTKVWGTLLNAAFFSFGRSKVLQAYESMLPPLPLPSVKETVERYVNAVDPLLNDEDRAKLAVAAHKFVTVEGPKLQFWLRLKWLFATNYVSDWWLNIVYLRQRSSTMISSNWYGIPWAKQYSGTQNQAALAASMTFTMIKMARQIKNGAFEPVLLGGSVPLCMAQYNNAFGMTRVPGKAMDHLVKADWSDSQHIAVLHRGAIFKLPVFDPVSGRQMTPLQLSLAFEGILRADIEPSPAEANLAALTCMARGEWRDVRIKYFQNDRLNRHSLHTIESAFFCVSLDTEAYPELIAECKALLCGNGTNRWADKSMTACVFKDGRFGFHAEHSWGDAPTMAHIMEHFVISNEKKEFYKPDGSIKELPEDTERIKANTFPHVAAERIRFNINSSLTKIMSDALTTYRASIDDLDLNVVEFGEFGKTFITGTAKCSPDAFLQMALQLAYYRDQGRFDHTYESSMTRLFREGRTETIRTVSAESCAFVKAMQDAAVPKERRAALLSTACEKHQKTSHSAMCGEGVDRHLFALLIVAYSYDSEIPQEFLQWYSKDKWRLSTSQVLPRQIPGHEALDEHRTPNGGFGPVVDDGYGVCYSLYGNKYLYFNVSAKNKAPNTDAKRFGECIRQALRDMKDLFPAAPAKPAAVAAAGGLQ